MLQNTDALTQGFLYAKGSAYEKELHPYNTKVTIGCWNICGTHLSQIYGGVVHWQYRLPAILETIRNNDPDIMVLQEVYDPEVSDLLVEGLKDRYTHLFVHLGPNPQGAEGGCMILSKYPIHSFTNTSFENNLPSLNRGFGILEIKASQKDCYPTLRIIGTHILYGYDALEKKKREEQLEQIKKHIDSLALCPTIIAADFNTERDDPSLSFLEHGYKGQKATCMTTSLIRQWDPSTNGPEEEWIDNISLVKGSNGSVQAHLIHAFNPESPNAKTALSDHHFLLGVFTANPESLPHASKDLVFQSTEAVKAACHTMLVSASTELDRFMQLSLEKEYDAAYRIWSNFLFRFFSLQLDIHQTMTLSTNDSIKEYAKNEVMHMVENFQTILSSSPVYDTFILNAKNAQNLSPQQRQITEAILKELEHIEKRDSLAILASIHKRCMRNK